jgi:hypothetical protein
VISYQTIVATFITTAEHNQSSSLYYFSFFNVCPESQVKASTPPTLTSGSI